MKRTVYASTLIPLVCLIFLMPSCIPAEEESFSGIDFGFSDPVVAAIADYQDQQASDSLAYYLQHPNPTYRYYSALAFASTRDSGQIAALGALLEDPDEQIRTAAAYALGQTRSRAASELLIGGFRAFDSTSVNTLSNAAILEAVGKTGDVQALRALSTVTTYQHRDTALLLGQVRGIYRFALRGIITSEGTSRCVELLQDEKYPQAVRVMAANYLFRAGNLDLAQYEQRLIRTFETDQDPRIRMTLAVALGRTKSNDALRSLKEQLSKETDYRVRCNILVACANFPYNRVRDLIFNTLSDKNLHVAERAARYFLGNGDRQDVLEYRAFSRGNVPWQLKTVMYEASNRYLPANYTITKNNLNNELRELFSTSDNPFEKGGYLLGLARDLRNYQEVRELGYSAKHPAIRTIAVEALVTIAGSSDLSRVFGRNMPTVRKDLATYMLEAIRTGDIAMIAIAADALANPELALQEEARPALDELKEALSKLNLPGAVETYNALSMCIATLENEEFQPYKIPHNNPIPWNLLNTLNDTVAAEIITSRGIVQLALFKNHAPGTVANFVRLSRDRFYHSKNVHRVVPNFVIQGGCPRGDGYGSLDYTIRSELGPMHFDAEGYIGMASAGNHTECTQWFITHSPTPHLDGNYTIFGQVTAGMNIVHETQVGDIIKEINILN